ncbi:MAG TPA: alpha-amylase family glycosyl hydrolase [Fulvivirga sp.]|nr:alpha-amylase family glycosyl hydrolase [Fulvivirga sp.]
MKLFSVIFLFFCAHLAFAQKVSVSPSISPEFFAADEPITITYNVTGTSLSSLTEAWLWLWLPDQSNVNVASNVNPANSNTTATNPAKFTKSVEGGVHKFTITITLTDFTDKSKEEISEVGMLIKGNDWSNGQSTDYVTSVSTGFELKLESPANNYGFYTSGQSINVVAKTSEPATFNFYLDGNLESTVNGTTLFETSHGVIDDGLVHKLKVTANNGTDELERTYSYTIPPTPQQVSIPSGLIPGINYTSDNTTATLVLLAPNKQNVFVVGDFNDWSLDNNYLMHQDGERFWLTINNLSPTTEYIFQYLIDGKILVADPYTDKVSDPWDDKDIDSETYPNLISYPDGKTSYRASVLQTGQTPYAWQTPNFVAPAKEDLVIYELLVRDFDERHSYRAVMDRLDYLQSLGINAIEFMPTNEFEGNQSWGYNPNFYFAPDKYYGTKNDFKALIDECHSRGIAVIIDLVLNHSFNSSPLARMYWNDTGGRPASDNPWYNEYSNFENPDAQWGVDFNHESIYTQNLVDSINSYWINEYKVDGFRFDFTKGFGNNFKSNSGDSWGSLYDAQRIALLKRMTDKIREVKSDAYVIFEHLAENKEEQELANYGIMLWGNMNHTYRDLAKGKPSSLISLLHTNRGWDEPNLVGYMESHDEERVAWDVFKTTDLTQGLQRLKLNAAFFFTVPGPKMIWQFGELGYDEELNNDRLGIKPTHWEYFDDPQRKELFDVYSSLIQLKKNTSFFDPTYFSWNSSSTIKYITIDHPDASISIVGNFGFSSEFTNAHFTKNGTWYDYFSGESIEVTDYANHEISLQGGDFKIFTSAPIENYIDGNPANYITSVEDYLKKGLTTLYPNPAGNFIYINTYNKWEKVTITDLQGKVVANSRITENRIDISGLQPGVYFVTLMDEFDTKIVKRLIKE